MLRGVRKGLQEVCFMRKSASYFPVQKLSTKRAAVLQVQDLKKSDGRTYTHQVSKTNQVNHKLTLFRDVNKSKMAFDLDNVTIGLQEAFVDKNWQEIARAITKGHLEKITFNHLSESVFRYKLNMQLRKLGGTSEFQRYNHDRGLATFEFIEH